MEFYDENIVLRLLKDEDIDFIAIVVSKWHALGIDAFLHSLSKEYNDDLNGIIIIAYHPKSGYCVDENDFFSRKFANIHFYFLPDIPYSNYKKVRGLINLIYRSRKKKIYMINILFPTFFYFQYFNDSIIAKKYFPHFILIDEGFGNYASEKRWHLTLERDTEYKYPFYRKIMLNIIHKITKSLKFFIFRYFTLEKRFLLDNNLELNTNIIDSYINVLNYRRRDIELENTVIFITHPYSEYNQLTYEQEVKLVEMIINITQKNGFDIALKPHPREKADKYTELLGKHNVYIIEQELLIEEILTSMKPKLLIGYHSSALVNAKLFFGIDSLCISKFAVQISDDQLLEIDYCEFKELTKNFVKFVENISELESLLDEK